MSIYTEVFPPVETLSPARLANNPPPKISQVKPILDQLATAAERGTVIQADGRVILALRNAGAIERARSSWYGDWYRLTDLGRTLLDELRQRTALVPYQEPCRALVAYRPAHAQLLTYHWRFQVPTRAA